MSRTISSDRSSERGFTLAGVLVAMTIIAVFVAYTVPRQWSIAVKRDRERQTLFIMKQYARAIDAFQNVHKSLPVSLDQLKEARSPRLLRGVKAEWADPLTGKVDWVLVPPQVAAQGTPTSTADTTSTSAADEWKKAGYTMRTGGGSGSGTSTSTSPSNATSTQATPSTAGQKGNSPKDYKGPFVGVRPPISGKSYLVLNGSDDYENWMYNLNDLQAEIKARDQAMTQEAQWK